MAGKRDESENEETTDSNVESGIRWLSDVPLFIDTPRVATLHDVIVEPVAEEFRSVPKETTREDEETEASEYQARGKGDARLKFSLSDLLPIGPKAEVGAEIEIEGKEHGEKRKYRAVLSEQITTPQRQLAQVAIKYDLKFPDRLFLNQSATSQKWYGPDEFSDPPKKLVFLDFPSLGEVEKNGNERLTETKFVPMAAEFSEGEVETIYDRLEEDGRTPPKYPVKEDYPNEDVTHRFLREKRRDEYWRWFDDHFSARRSMEAVEEVASEQGRINWIAFRTPLTDQGHTLHLTVHPRGQYSTGDFAYNFINRTNKHGVRLIGTVKSEPSMDVLAIYEK